MSRPNVVTPGSAAGFTYLELLVAATLLLFGLLSLASMFLLGYAFVSGAGNTTMGLAAARQLLEDARTVPYDQLANLNGFDTEDPSTLPADEPERSVARRWRYALAGSGAGWTFSAEEQARWPRLADQGDALGAAGSVAVVEQTPTISEVTVTVLVPGRWQPIEISTLVANLQ